MELKNLNPDGSADTLPIVQPNLLHNWDFRAPVNQRETPSGSAYSAVGGYVIDRWALNYGTVTPTIGTGLTLAPGTRIGQLIERQYKGLLGRQCAASLLLADGSIKSTQITFPSVLELASSHVYATVPDVGEIGVGFAYRATAAAVAGENAHYIPYFNVTAAEDKTVTIAAVKLELGTASTLAQDPPMDYGAELLRCMWYYRRKYLLQYGTIGVYACGPTYCVIALPVGVPMRVKPTLRITGSIGFIGSAVPTITSAWNVNSQDPTSMEATSTASTSGAGYAYAADTGGILIEHIADL